MLRQDHLQDLIRCISVAKTVWIVGVMALVLSLAACQPVAAVNGGLPTESGLPVIEQIAELQETATATPIDSPVDARPVAQSATPGPVVFVQIEAGMTVYRSQYCGICHTLEAVGTTGTFGPPHERISVTAAVRIQDLNYSGEAKTAEEYLYESLVTPDVYLVDGFANSSHRMPPYSHLPEEELQALVTFLMAQR